MSKRRSVSDIVRIKDEHGDWVAARILGLDRGDSFDECARVFMGQCDDEACKEWHTLAIVEANSRPTGDHFYHVSECEMKDWLG